LIPVTPQKLAGWRIEPPVSVPVAAGSWRAATAAADRPRSRRHPLVSHGLRVMPVGRVLGARAHGELIAVELARVTAPAAEGGTIVASKGLR
jgi:hypothetical protein